MAKMNPEFDEKAINNGDTQKITEYLRTGVPGWYIGTINEVELGGDSHEIEYQ
jgi:glycosidase